jgi:predicted MFS family arabinose efflux permease
MSAGVWALIAAYVLSQFTRACLAVLAPLLKSDLGATAGDLADASGLWFLTFAAMQLPVGWALDRFGPRRVASILMAVGGGGGAAMFALAAGPGQVKLAMGLIGVGFAPVLMSSYFIFARTQSAARFGTLAGIVVGIGTLGNLASATPLAWAAETLGWRVAIGGIGGISLVLALLVYALVRDPVRSAGGGQGSLLTLFRMPALWPILAMMAVCYTPIAALRGFWIGPYYADVFGWGTDQIGTVTLIVGVAMVAGTFAFGPLERALGTRKGLILPTNLIDMTGLFALWALPATPGTTTLALFAAIGLFGASFPMVIAHGRAFIPPHLTGRGVTLLNLFGIAPVGIAQFLTGRLHGAIAPVPPEAPFKAVFLALAILVALGCLAYAFSKDRTD